MKLHLQGWRYYTQSVALVHQNYCYGLSQYADFQISHEELPPPPPHILRKGTVWSQVQDIQGPEKDTLIRAIPDWSTTQGEPDCTVRTAYPYDFTPAQHGNTLVFSITETNALPDILVSGPALRDIASNHRVKILTASEFSRQALIESGAAAERTLAIPLGYDPALFFPLAAQKRELLRQRLGWQDQFVFLSVSAMYIHKGIDLTLKAFAEISVEFPNAILVLKGNDSAYVSKAALHSAITNLSDTEWQRIQPKLRYLGKATSMAQIANYYHAADVLLSPYRAEGFNLPVIEAAACGLPVICTAGGPTDETTTAEFAWRIPSKAHTIKSEFWRGDWLEPDYREFHHLMRLAITRPDLLQAARLAGPKHVRQRYTWQHVTHELAQAIRHF
ncbi:glycosyltransferase family 4 protein [Undibacterium fentianense]|uniref:Glycosyltransferase family 4 protein n=1 Tax=Undibacterium fentianense TaxID=2828728 RepID=A0A941E3R0_9BURK|nr:glycosyltransferase family 4 protein [Undibacterium fentianense]MBR7800547.1 glycosyltransferase family 4 protein [Undibacterium fentianense]